MTIEEREEYEALVKAGTVVYAGVDYGAILEQAQEECDVLLWDGGNNDLPFYRPDLHITVTDPLRAGHERTYHPGETNLLMANIVLINKVGGANADQIASIERSTAELNPEATILRADSVVELDHPEVVAGQAVLVVEDGPTLTHGGMKYGAGVVAARHAGASEIVDPRPYVTGTIGEMFEKYDVGPVLPAEGYSEAQLGELEQAIAATPCDALVIGTPIDLRHLIRLTKPVARATYRLQEPPGSGLLDALEGVIARARSVSLG